jgi:hypothetical protein
MSEGQGLSSYFEGISLKIIMFKFEDKVTANNRKNKQNLDFWPWMSRSFMDEGLG